MGFENNIKKGAESGIQALKDGTNVVVSEVSKLLKISEKKIDINSYKKKIEKNYTTLGELVHRYLTDGVTNPLDQADVREVLQNIYNYNEKIKELQGEIEIIRSMKVVGDEENNGDSNGENGEGEEAEDLEKPEEEKKEAAPSDTETEQGESKGKE
ncbi:MAG: hypothetical protein DSY91_06290 [Deltaproteobacteria bacterium]|nr:MAG: hypothetical protein DSY91_06290 [Deltaproteobacteria bacterium]